MMSLVRRIIYTPPLNLVIRSTLRPFEAVLPTSLKIPVVGRISVDTEAGGSIEMLTNQTNRLAQDVFWGGIRGYEFPSLRVFMHLIREARCLIDVGANIGYYSLIAARLNPQVQCYAFEPMPGALVYLKKNIELNGLGDKIEPLGMAVAETEGEVELFVTRNPKALHLEHHLGGSSSTARAKDEHSQSVTVPMQSLDSFVADREITRVDIMKLDTEATEDKVLAGARNVVERDRPFIQCEVLPNRIERELESFFSAFGYVPFMPEESGLHRLDTILGHADAKDYFFVPESRLDAVAPLVVSG